ncbi:hypothetical protein [Ochrobactrum sp. Marseille-Q0166]|uniref:hypothetical protein n=1 Tax=Ochrobactrum sp. Marseille-Q0166 TaxID=2761105 RepID=UPI001655F6BD|nr:hypothetical protein [Ochrobactrum sp. Marseille-Q0166]MBC8718186.1 hypothetical protein [Ochrobactrum sp. Marseille-Q0166]
MDPIFNPARGEASCQIGNTKIVMVVEFARLAQLCQLADCDDMQTLYKRLIGFHPKTVMAAIRVLTTHPDGDDEARKQAHLAMQQLSAADEPAFRDAITKALTGHIAEGRKSRGEENLLPTLIVPLKSSTRETPQALQCNRSHTSYAAHCDGSAWLGATFILAFNLARSSGSH